MKNELSEKKRFSLVSRVKSANHAVRGIGVFFRSSHNMWGHAFFAVLATYMGYALDISRVEWIFLVFAMGFVIITETINTSIEIDIDLTSPTYHPYARDTKDVAAGAVLISIIMACIVASIIFFPKLWPIVLFYIQ